MVNKSKGTPLSNFIANRMEIMGLTQADVAKAMSDQGFKCASSTVAHWVSKTDPASPRFENRDFIDALAGVLGTQPVWLAQAAGLLQGIDNPIAESDREWITFAQSLPPHLQKVLRELAETLVRAQDTNQDKSAA